MKKTIQVIILFTVAFMGISTFISAQDEIIKNDGKKMNVWIKEVGDTQIKYIEVGDPNEIVFTINRVLVKSVEFSYGKKMIQETGEYSDEYFADDKNQNLKINFSTIIGNNLIMTYERAISPLSSIETSIKIFGLGLIDDGRNRRGMGLDFGYKMKLKSLFKSNGTYRPSHLLHGGYVKPMIGFHALNRNRIFSSSRVSHRLMNIGMDIGKQWILNNKLSIDIHTGLHYYGGSEYITNTNGISDEVYLSSFSGGDIVGFANLALSFGIRIGGIFGSYSDQNNGMRKKR